MSDREPIVTEMATYTRWECPFCGYDSVDEARVREHLDPVWGKHPIPVIPPSAAATLAATEPSEPDAPPKRGKASKE